MLTRCTFFSLVVVFSSFGLSSSISAQNSPTLTVPLSLNTDYQQEPFISSIEFDAEVGGSNARSAQGRAVRHGRLPGGLSVSVESVVEPASSYLIKVSARGDGKYFDGESQLLIPDGSVAVRIPRKWANGKQMILPYTLSYSKYLNADKQIEENFSWRPHYAADGIMKVNNCQAKIRILDLNGDGIFDRQDFKRGTTIQLDINGDGRFWGAAEHLSGEQVIKFCGKSFLTADIESSGSSIIFRETNITIPKLGERVPQFVTKTIEGKYVDTDKLKGSVVLLDFWASWCMPCVKKFTRLQEIEKGLKGKFDIIAINVDAAERLLQAKEVVSLLFLPLGAWLKNPFPSCLRHTSPPFKSSLPHILSWNFCPRRTVTKRY